VHDDCTMFDADAGNRNDEECIYTDKQDKTICSEEYMVDIKNDKKIYN
jgi:hypothetical protein